MRRAPVQCVLALVCAAYFVLRTALSETGWSLYQLLSLNTDPTSPSKYKLRPH